VGHDWLRSVISQGEFEILNAISVPAHILPQSNVLTQQPHGGDRLCFVIRQDHVLNPEWIVRLLQLL